MSVGSWIVVEIKTGLIDGFYSEEEYAVQSAMGIIDDHPTATILVAKIHWQNKPGSISDEAYIHQ